MLGTLNPVAPEGYRVAEGDFGRWLIRTISQKTDGITPDGQIRIFIGEGV